MSPQPSRNATLDYARFFAAIGIVAFHTGTPGASVGYAGLLFFVILLALLGLGQSATKAQTLPAYLKSRAERLLIPWLGWCLIYGALKLTEATRSGTALAEEFSTWMLLTGPALHLWFLPFAFGFSLMLWALFPLYRAEPKAHVHQILWFTFASLALALPISASGAGLALPLPQYAFALPGLCLGLAFAFEPRPIWRWATMAVLSLGWVACGLPGGSLQLIIAGGAVLLCYAWPSQSTANSRLLANLSLTIYLAHPLVLSLAARLFHLPHKGGAIFTVGVIATVLLCLVLPVALRSLPQKMPVQRFLGV